MKMHQVKYVVHSRISGLYQAVEAQVDDRQLEALRANENKVVEGAEIYALQVLSSWPVTLPIILD